MTISGISTAAAVGAYSPQPVSPSAHQKHNHFHSLSDVDAQGSSVASSPSTSGKTGSKVDISA
jgi:hypothetical protein